MSKVDTELGFDLGQTRKHKVRLYLIYSKVNMQPVKDWCDMRSIADQLKKCPGNHIQPPGEGG